MIPLLTIHRLLRRKTVCMYVCMYVCMCFEIQSCKKNDLLFLIMNAEMRKHLSLS